MIYISKIVRNYDIYIVSISNEEVIFDMIEYFIKKGYEKIVFIMMSKDDIVLEMERFVGYEKVFLNNNIELDKSLIKYGGIDYESGYNSMKELLDDGIIFYVVFVIGDEVVIGVINVICDVGYKVLEDIFVVGFNDVKIVRMYRFKFIIVY